MGEYRVHRALKSNAHLNGNQNFLFHESHTILTALQEFMLYFSGDLSSVTIMIVLYLVI